VQDLCEVVAMPAHSAVSGDKLLLPVAMCGFDYVGNVTVADEQMAQMKSYARVMPVVAMPHMGVEYRAVAEEAKVATYHRLIDSGADLVVGAHPHVVQNTEVYQGKLIAYSVGNFLFDQQILGEDTTRTLGVGVDLSIDDQKAVAVYQQVGPSCKAYKDDCLVQLEKQLSARPVIQAKYDFQYFDESSGTPVRASEAVASAIKEQAGIAQLEGLKATW